MWRTASLCDTRALPNVGVTFRPTWDPAQARDVKGGSRQYSTRDMASQTKLKFRCACQFITKKEALCLALTFLNYRQPGQTSSEEVKRRDLRAELLAAEQEVRDRKRKAEGKPITDSESAGLAITTGDDDTEESNKRRKLLQEVIALDKDDDSSDEDEPKRNEHGESNGEGDSE